MRRVNRFIVHCSDTPKNTTVASIRAHHMRPKSQGGRGWSDIGYHFIIDQKGNVHKGRPVERQGAHVAGHNKDSVGVCLIGRHEFTPAQFAALQGLYKDFLEANPKLTYHAHNEFNKYKTCPNFDVKTVLGHIAHATLISNKTKEQNNMEQNNTKKWYQSKAVWGGLLALFAGLAQIFGYSITEVDQQQAVDLVMGVATAFGGMLAWFGRIAATKRIAK